MNLGWLFGGTGRLSDASEALSKRNGACHYDPFWYWLAVLLDAIIRVVSKIDTAELHIVVMVTHVSPTRNRPSRLSLGPRPRAPVWVASTTCLLVPSTSFPPRSHSLLAAPT